MRLLEHEAKQLLRNVGIITPREIVTSSPDEAARFARELNAPVVLKAQVPAGGRMKAGGVLFASNDSEAEATARALLGQTIRGYPVEQVGVQERLLSQSAFYLAVTFDARARRALLLGSREGGIEIESAAQVERQTLSLREAYPLFRAREMASRLLPARGATPDAKGDPAGSGVVGAQHAAPVPLADSVAREGAQYGSVAPLRAAVGSDEPSGAQYASLLQALTDVIFKLVQVFRTCDALLVEINPLLLTSDGTFSAVDAHFELDDDALFRQRDLAARFGLARRGERPRSALEQRAAEIDGADHRGVAGRVVEFDGDLALLIGGGGASLTIFDAILDAGGRPANYCEIGGNPSVWKIAELTRLLLGKPGVQKLAVIMNVVNNTRADLVARGVIKGIVESGREPREVIAAFRIPGSWEEESVKILDRYGVRHFGREVSLNEVAALVVRS